MEVDAASRGGIENAHAVRPTERDSSLVAQPNNFRMSPLGRLIIGFVKPAGIYRSGSNALLDSETIALEKPVITNAKRGQIDRPRNVGKARVTAMTQNGFVVRIDRIDRPLKAELAETGEDRPSRRRRPFGRTHDRYRTRA